MHHYACILLLLGSIAIATEPYRSNCADFNNCVMCASHLSWLGTQCKWCPIDRQCHAAGSLQNKCSNLHNVMDPSRCGTNIDNSYKYNASLSYYAAIMSGAAYAPNAAACVGNFLENEKLLNLKQVTVDCDSMDDDCSAFVGRSATKKLIILSFRGTHGKSQLLIEGLMGLTLPKQQSRVGGKVQQYFNNAFNSLWPSLLPSLKQLIGQYGSDHRILVTGHSLGGAIAALAAVELAAFHSVGRESLIYFTFGEPRVGDYDFTAAFDALVPNAWRVVHASDIVVHLPMCSPVVATSSSSSRSNMHAATGRHHTKTPTSTSKSAFSCSSRFGLPYHHGTEVFFGPGVSMRPDSEGYRVCRGVPLNEDATCSNASDNWIHCLNPVQADQCLQNHLIYYGIHLGKWWDINRCTAFTDPALAV